MVVVWICIHCTQVSEGVFASQVEAHGGQSLAGSCFHADICHGQKLNQNLLHILLMEQFTVLS